MPRLSNEWIVIKWLAFMLIGSCLFIMQHELTHKAVSNAYGIQSEIQWGVFGSYTKFTEFGAQAFSLMSDEMKASWSFAQALVEMIGYSLQWIIIIYCIKRTVDDIEW